MPQTIQELATDRESIRAVVPPMLLMCGWSTKDKPEKGVWEGPSGIRTVGHFEHGAPYGPDRWIVLYMAAKAAQHGQRFRGTLQEITGMFKLPWSRTATLARLRRVAACWIEHGERYDEISPRTSMVQLFRIRGDQFEIGISAELLAEVRNGPAYDLDIAVQFGKSYGSLDVYLWGIWALHASAQGQRVPEPKRILSLPSATFKAYQRLRDHLDRIQEVDPMFPFRWCSERNTLAIWYHPKKYPPDAPRQYPRLAAEAARPEMSQEAAQTAPARPMTATPGIQYVRPRPSPTATTRPRQRPDAAPGHNTVRSRPRPTADTRPPSPSPWEPARDLALSVQEYAKLLSTVAVRLNQLGGQRSQPLAADLRKPRSQRGRVKK